VPLVSGELEHDLGYERGGEEPKDDDRREDGRERREHACHRSGYEPQHHVGVDECRRRGELNRREPGHAEGHSRGRDPADLVVPRARLDREDRELDADPESGDPGCDEVVRVHERDPAAHVARDHRSRIEEVEIEPPDRRRG
jgi:hypothetical protein